MIAQTGDILIIIKHQWQQLDDWTVNTSEGAAFCLYATEMFMAWKINEWMNYLYLDYDFYSSCQSNMTCGENIGYVSASQWG